MAKSKRKKGNAGKVVIAVIAIAALCIGGKYAYDKAQIKKMMQVVNIDTFYNGISVNGVDLSGLTSEEAQAKLNTDVNDAIKTKTVTLNKDDDSYVISFGDIDAEYNIDDTLLAAYNYGRNGELKERYKEVVGLEKHPKDFEAQFTYSDETLKSKINEIAEEVKVEPKDSTMTRQNGTFVITDEQVGYEMDTDSVYNDSKAVVDTMDSGNVEIKMKELQPKITRAENEKATSLIGSYYTTFTSGNAGRNENLRVGCANINGTELAPGDVFSMNVELGPQTYENGYRNAAVIVNGKIEDGLAGGVCQITSTLYNAVILAELQIVERSNHSLAVSYVPLGQDAAIAGDYKDLKFKNNTDYPVYIEAYISGNKLIANIYGHEIHDSSRQVKFENVVNSVIEKPAEKVTEDNTKPKGYREVTHYGKEGKKVTTYKIVYENGKQISKDYFSTSTYRATADEVTVGTKEETPDTADTSKTDTNENNNSDDGTVFGN